MHRSSTSDAKHKVTRSTPTCSHVGTDSLPHYHAPITFLAFKYKYLHLSLLIIIFIFSISNKISLNKNLNLLLSYIEDDKFISYIFLEQKKYFYFFIPKKYTFSNYELFNCTKFSLHSLLDITFIFFSFQLF